MKRSIEPCGQFKAEPGAEVVAYSLCQTCGWNAYQHLSLIDTGSQNVTGYQQRTQAHLDLVNAVKHEEKVFGDFLRDIYFGMAKEFGIKLDPRQVASARTHFEYAFYHLNRAVFQPAIKEGPR
jgi:hypothetical protein